MRKSRRSKTVLLEFGKESVINFCKVELKIFILAPKNKPVGVSFNDNGIEFILQPFAENENFTIKQDDECFFKRISRSDQTTTTVTRWLYLQNYTSKAGFRFRYEGEFDKIHNAFKKIIQKKFERKGIGLKLCFFIE